MADYPAKTPDHRDKPTTERKTKHPSTCSLSPIRRGFLALLMTAVGDTYRLVLQAVQRGVSHSPVPSHPVRAITLRALTRWMTTETLPPPVRVARPWADRAPIPGASAR